jgi:hypothetical protein
MKAHGLAILKGNQGTIDANIYAQNGDNLAGRRRQICRRICGVAQIAVDFSGKLRIIGRNINFKYVAQIRIDKDICVEAGIVIGLL